ncbi:hypothetical protein TcCL_NonESM05501 [Trypanosoma cruzi]|nr:hypothetical protein TcCL_NonESM05501 [Trypanosoma cruzi]
MHIPQQNSKKQNKTHARTQAESASIEIAGLSDPPMGIRVQVEHAESKSLPMASLTVPLHPFGLGIPNGTFLGTPPESPAAEALANGWDLQGSKSAAKKQGRNENQTHKNTSFFYSPPPTFRMSPTV